MSSLLRLVWAIFHALFAHRADLVAENLALRQQLNVLRRKVGRPRLRRRDRIFWLWLARSWDGWRDALIVVKPATVVRWHRQGFKYYWTWKSRHKGGRPAIDPEVRDLIRRMSRANPLWGAPRIHGELLKLAAGEAWTRFSVWTGRYRRGHGSDTGGPVVILSSCAAEAPPYLGASALSVGRRRVVCDRIHGLFEAAQSPGWHGYAV